MRRAAFTAVLAAVLAAPAAAPAAGVKLERLARFGSPVYVTSEPADADRLYVVERRGKVKLLVKGRRRKTPFLDISRKVKDGGEQGLLNIAFPPDYADSGRFYVYYSAKGGDIAIEQYRRSASNEDRADASSGRRVLKIEHSSHPNHYGSAMHFGSDGALYVSTGDGGGVGNPSGSAQKPGSPLGKILRFADPAKSGGYAVWARGLRNPWRFSFDRSSGAAVIGDVGQDKVEEVDFMPFSRLHGANFGWKAFEGNSRFAGGGAPGHVRPAIVHSHSSGWCSIIGGHVVRDPELPALAGRYVYGDLCQGRIWSAKLSSGGASGDGPTSLRVNGLASFGEDSAGRVYAVELGGTVYRLVPR